METSITFSTGELILEGLLTRTPGDQGAVITHPHSLYGGNMYNPVVEAISRVYRKHGVSTLRFNFRGVGSSQGQFEDGIGEQQDVLAAIQFLLDSGINKLQLAGYSFGSRVIAGIQKLPKEVVCQHHIAPPVAFMDYSGVGGIEELQTVIVGADDDIAPPQKIKKLLQHWNSETKMIVIDEADHFFTDCLDLLEKELARVVTF